MKKLNAILNEPTYISRHDSIVAAKTDSDIREALQGIQEQVSGRYQLFHERMLEFNLHTIPVDVRMIQNKKHLQSCYKNKTKNTLKIFEAIRSAQIKGTFSKCPYCGITYPHTHDHYLPKSEYPEYSVHANNLVPCCSKCNSTMGNRVAAEGERLFVHYYSDTFPNEQFLHVKIMSNPNIEAFGFQFFIQKPNNFPVVKWNIIENHFKYLKLLKRYEDNANDEYVTCLEAAKAHVRYGGSNIQQFVNDSCNHEAVKFGINHWRFVLKTQLASTQKFIDVVMGGGA